MQTYNIPASPAVNPSGTPIVRAGSQAALIRNADPTSAVFLSFVNSIDVTTLSNAIMLNAGGVVVVDGSRDVYVTTSAAAGFTPVQVIEGGISFFQPASSLRLTDPSGTDFILLSTGRPPFIEIGTGDVAETVPAKIISGTIGSGPTRQLGMEIFANRVSGEPAGAQAVILLLSPSVDLTIGAALQVTVGDGTSSGFVTVTPTSVTLSGNQLQAQRNNQSVAALFGTIPVTQNDNVPVTVAAAALTRLTKAWSIPGNDANASTTYRLTCWGNGVQGSTQETLTFNVTAFGVSGAGSGYAATFAGASVSFVWVLTAYVQVTSTGAGAAVVQFNWHCEIKPSGAAVSQDLSGGSTLSTANTTINQNMQVNAQWGAVTGAPTITCTGSILERIGA